MSSDSDKCPKCGSKLVEQRLGRGSLFWMVCSTGSEYACNLRRAAKELLDHPYPCDLFAMRREVRDQFCGSDADAQEALRTGEIEAWCSEEYCIQEYRKHVEAVEQFRKAVEG